MVTVGQVHEFCLNNSLVFYTVMTMYTEHTTPINDVTWSCGLWHTAIRTHMEMNVKFFKAVMTLCFQMIKAEMSKTWECILFSEMILESMTTSISIGSFWLINIWKTKTQCTDFPTTITHNPTPFNSKPVETNPKYSGAFHTDSLQYKMPERLFPHIWYTDLQYCWSS